MKQKNSVIKSKGISPEERKSLSKELSPEEKNKRMKKANRRIRRRVMQQPRSNSIRTLSIKMGRYRDQLTEVNKELEFLKDAIDEALSNLQTLFKLPIIVEAVKEFEEKEKFDKVADKVHEENKGVFEKLSDEVEE